MKFYKLYLPAYILGMSVKDESRYYFAGEESGTTFKHACEMWSLKQGLIKHYDKHLNTLFSVEFKPNI